MERYRTPHWLLPSLMLVSMAIPLWGLSFSVFPPLVKFSAIAVALVVVARLSYRAWVEVEGDDDGVPWLGAFLMAALWVLAMYAALETGWGLEPFDQGTAQILSIAALMVGEAIVILPVFFIRRVIRQGWKNYTRVEFMARVRSAGWILVALSMTGVTWILGSPMWLWLGPFYVVVLIVAPVTLMVTLRIITVSSALRDEPPVARVWVRRAVLTISTITLIVGAAMLSLAGAMSSLLTFSAVSAALGLLLVGVRGVAHKIPAGERDHWGSGPQRETVTTTGGSEGE